MLILNEVVMYGTMEEIKDEPPTIVVEIFDQDRVVSYNILPFLKVSFHCVDILLPSLFDYFYLHNFVHLYF